MPSYAHLSPTSGRKHGTLPRGSFRKTAGLKRGHNGSSMSEDRIEPIVVSIAGAARRLSVGVSTIRCMIQDGRLPHTCIVGTNAWFGQIVVVTKGGIKVRRFRKHEDLRFVLDDQHGRHLSASPRVTVFKPPKTTTVPNAKTKIQTKGASFFPKGTRGD